MKRRFKRSGYLLVLLLAVCLTATVVEKHVKNEITAAVSVVSDVSAKPDSIIQFRTEREQLREMQKMELNDIIYAQDAEEEIIGAAQKQLLRQLETEQLETLTEGILHLRGFEDALVIINGENVSVLIREESLDAQKSILIMDLIGSQTGISAGNVKIIPIN